MSCPSCSHTMQNLRDVVFWCPRCGTIADHAGGGFFERPKLVERCRAFEAHLGENLSFDDGNSAYNAVMRRWQADRVSDSINKPEDRPQ